jgi:hypothetical protein
MKSHTIFESVILQGSCKILNIMFGKEYKYEVLKIPMLDDSISRRIQNMSQDVESQDIANITEANFLTSSRTSQLTSLEEQNS